MPFSTTKDWDSKGQGQYAIYLVSLSLSTMPGNVCSLMEERGRQEGFFTGSLLNELQGKGKDLTFVSAIDEN